MRKMTMMLGLVGIFAGAARGQGYLDLNFESAYNLPGNPGNGVSVSVTNSLPGWAAYNGDNVLPDIYYVSNSLGDVGGPVRLEGGSLALSGDFSVGLYLAGSISQTGTVSANAESLEFEAESPSLSASGFYVILGGQTLSYSALSQGSGYTVYGANIPEGMGGQVEPLTFGISDLGQALLDNIEFSTTGVPEPAEWALIGIGVVLFGFWRRRLTAKNA